ncbi:hypothetical protein JCM3774_001486 [Rhodotorula dairenensis]
MAASLPAEQTEQDAVARAAQAKYASLPRRGKPKRRDNRVREWTVMAAVCLVSGSGADRHVHCVSIGTGLKALPHSKLPVHGDVLHDSHAEVIARRGFHLWTYAQLEKALRAHADKGKHREQDCVSPADIEFFEREHSSGHWRLRPEWRVVFYVSTLPCGDASTYVLAAAAADAADRAGKLASGGTRRDGGLPTDTDLSARDAKVIPSLAIAASLGLSTARDVPTGTGTPSMTLPSSTVHRGRVSYSSFSCLRTKPGRADSPPTTSHSCSDKLAVWSLLGLQGALLSQLGVEKIPLDSLVVGGVPAQHRDRIRDEVRRAVGGRLEDWARSVGVGPDEFVPPDVGFTECEFEHGREAVAADEGCDASEIASCSESLSYVADLDNSTDAVEIINNGIRQGAPSRRQHSDQALLPKARSRLCKLSLFDRFASVQQQATSDEDSERTLSSPLPTYYACKHARTDPASQVPARPNPGERYQAIKTMLRAPESGPFAGWLVSGASWESFDWRGCVEAGIVEEIKAM